MELIHTLFQPAGEGPFPTLLTLHGRGANAFDLLGLAPYLCDGKFMMICPQGPAGNSDRPGRGWLRLVSHEQWRRARCGSDAELRRKSYKCFSTECLKSYPIDPKKLAVLGFSQGGVMAYSLALANPERFAALAVLSSWLPKELLPRLNVNDAVQSLPTLVQHGTQDPMIEVDRARSSVEMLRQLRLPLTFREYQMGHEIGARSLADCRRGWKRR